MRNQYLHFYYYTPKSHLEITKQAIFTAGAGCMGKYTCCAWQTKGIGQFKPLAGSNAYVGKVGKLEKVNEYKVETICPSSKIKKVIKALKKSHPYEHPAFGLVKLSIQ